MPDLGTVWFVLVAVLFAGYAVLDGFDLGVGILHLFVARKDEERRVTMNSIAPFWDGNEVWLLAGGGALFAAFPPFYATLFSGLYVPLMLVLAGLIFRAVSLEFRGKEPGAAWRRTWDVGFAVGSFLPALLLGVAAGNVARGMPVTKDGELAAGFFSLLNPFALGVGLFGLALFVQHGAAWLVLKTGSPVAERARRAALVAWGAVALLWVVLLFASRTAAPLLWGPYPRPSALLFPAAFHVALVAFPFALRSGRRGAPFLLSSLAVLALFGILAQGLYPNLLPALGTPERSLTIWNASSTPRTLSTMLAIALFGVPVVLAYTAFIYRRFKGTVVVDEHSY